MIARRAIERSKCRYARGVVVTHLLKSGLKKHIYRLVLYINIYQCPDGLLDKTLNFHPGDPSSIPSSAKITSKNAFVTPIATHSVGKREMFYLIPKNLREISAQ